jgi:myo-inositol 2-dehydrogenase/D-chiro-inositol 1-dehydrogenase
MPGPPNGLLARNDVDALVIASPNHFHVPQLRDIARTVPCPSSSKSPSRRRPEDNAALRDLARAYPAPIWVAMEYRYMPPIARFRELAEEATGGIRMLTIREHRFPFLEKVGDWNRFNRNTGGTMVEKCCHFFDLMRLILRDEPVRVMASAGQAVNHLDETYAGETPDIWDHGYVIVDFARGARAMLELCMFAEGSDYQEEMPPSAQPARSRPSSPAPPASGTSTWGHSPSPT